MGGVKSAEPHEAHSLARPFYPLVLFLDSNFCDFDIGKKFSDNSATGHRKIAHPAPVVRFRTVNQRSSKEQTRT